VSPTARATAANTQLSIAVAEDLPWIYTLQRRFARALGWIPKEAMQEPITQQRIILASENGDPAGFLFHKALHGEPHVHTIVQAAVAMDAQRRHHGLAALNQLEQSIDEDLLQCWCAEELESNAFWFCAGFEPIAIRDPKNCRGRRLILWRKALTETGKVLITDEPLRAGPQAARPRNMVMLTPEQRVSITAETPEAVQEALAKIHIDYPARKVEVTVDGLVTAYAAIKSNPALAHLAGQVAAQIAEEMTTLAELRRKDPHRTGQRKQRARPNRNADQMT
jgi:hypothetical protein